ncbi:MAG TPA: DUF4956 domain-containing protein [Bacteroidia bacterium]|jgi:hypothetical protein|nr:DUF4956 domain-containing protein [Bacteroidia bacterium]
MFLLQVASEVAKPETIVAVKDFITRFGGRFIIDILSVYVLIRVVYVKIYKHRELFFTYFIFNLIIFLLCFFLNKVKISMGAAFGLFAVFGMLRYRTEEFSIKDMTYLFLVISIGLMTAVIKLENIEYYYEFIFIGVLNAFIILLTYLLESNLLMRKEVAKQIIYENIELIKPEKRSELLLDIENRMGVKVNRITITKVDFLKDVAFIKIYFYEE